MRLQRIHISDYKNLKDFDLTFENANSLEIFVGKNGTGKSNLFEALIEIFRHLEEFDSDGEGISFDYRISYEIGGIETAIKWENGQLAIDDQARKTVGKTPRPENILVYYSGHNDTVSGLIGKYQSAFRGRIKGADFADTRYFIGVGSHYKQLLLAVCLLKPAHSHCRQIICSKLGIADVVPELKLTLKRPYYAKSSDFDVHNNDETDRFWKAAGITKTFLDQLLSFAAPPPTGGRVRTEGYLASEDKYVLFLDSAKLAEAFKESAPHELFSRFDNLMVLEMLEDISILLKLTNGAEANTSYFSDGQFQSVYIFAITEIFKARQSLTLLDEPDSFLHPQWQHEFLSQIAGISDSASKTNHTLLSSHSASTISSISETKISLFEINGNTVKVSQALKGEVITSLSAGLITFSESEARLNIQHVLSTTTGPVLFTEGITDEIILETAWSKLYPGEDRPFEIQNAFDCFFLANLLKRDSLYQSHPDRVFFGVFDFDEAFSSWERINEDVTFESDPEKCLTKKNKQYDGYGLLLPVPSVSTIKGQVINANTGGTFRYHSLLTIELLFHDVPGLEAHFKIDAERTDGFKKFTGKKTTFAKNVVPNIDAQYFKVFEPLFDFVRAKCGAPIPLSAATE